MRNWTSWIWPGVAAVACLTALALWLEHKVVEADLEARTLAALEQQHGWARLALDGRDLTLQGEAPAEESRSAALQIARDVYGVRIVRDETRLLPLEAPYRFSAEKTEAGVTLTGFAPDQATRAAIVAQLSQMLPGIAISDQIKLARGAPDKLMEFAAYGMSAFPRFSTGSLEISDLTMRINGQALSPEDHETALQTLSVDPPTGATLKALDISAASAEGDYRFTAAIDGSNLKLSGYAPDFETRASIRSAAEAVRADLTVTDELLYATGVPEGVDWAAAAAETVALVTRMTKGRADIEGRRLDLSGQVTDGAAFREIQAALGRQLAGGLVLGTADIGVARVSPFTWSASVSDDGLLMSGFVPDDATRARLSDAAGLKFGALAIDDRLQVASGAPEGFATAALAALQALSRLEDASVDLVDAKVSIAGLALTPPAQEAIADNLTEMLPQDFAVERQIEIKPLPSQPLDGVGCQDELNRLVATNTILFETAEAGIALHSHGFLDRIAFAALRCGDARLEVSGHTDSDGAEAFNLALSKRRAEAVLTYLSAAGVASNRLEAIGFGESRPVADNETEAGKADNRRIEFRVVN